MCLSELLPNDRELGKPLPTQRMSGHAPPKLKSGKDRSGPSKERVNRFAYACILGLCIRRAFYSAQEKAIIVLIKHFDLLCNDGYLGGDKTIITILDGRQMLSKVVS